MRFSVKNISGARLNKQNVIGIKNNEQMIYPYESRNKTNLFIYNITRAPGNTGSIYSSVSDDSKYFIKNNHNNTDTDWGDGKSTGLQYHYYEEPGLYTVKTVNYPGNKGIVVELISFRYDFIDMNNLFKDWSQLEKADALEYYGTSRATSMNSLFYGCKKLRTLNLSRWDTSSVTDMSNMFYNCETLRTIGDISGWNTKKVTDMSLMFNGCCMLEDINVSNLNTSNVTSMEFMFGNCSSLTELDVSNFNTGNTTTMFGMFYGCNSLTSLDTRYWDTSNVTSIGNMFRDCTRLKYIDTSLWKISNLGGIAGLFYNCSSLEAVTVNHFDVSNAMDMATTFKGCASLKSLNISNWKTHNIWSFHSMFADCSSLTSLDLRNFDTNKAVRFYNMFAGCTSLQSLDIRNFKFIDIQVGGNYGDSLEKNTANFLADCISLHELRLDNCDRFTIETIINSTNFPINPIAGVTRKIYCKKANTKGLTEPANWKFEYVDEDAQ